MTDDIELREDAIDDPAHQANSDNLPAPVEGNELEDEPDDTPEPADG